MTESQVEASPALASNGAGYEAKSTLAGVAWGNINCHYKGLTCYVPTVAQQLAMHPILAKMS